MKAFVLVLALVASAQAAQADGGVLICKDGNKEVISSSSNTNFEAMWDCAGTAAPGEKMCFKGDAQQAQSVLSDLATADFFSDEFSLYDSKLADNETIEFTLLDMPNETTTGPYTIEACK